MCEDNPVIFICKHHKQDATMNASTITGKFTMAKADEI
jgi:hypothetical protein